MPDFRYEALDTSGRATSGTVSARDTVDAAVKVRSMGVFPTQIGVDAKGNGASNGRTEAPGAAQSISGTLRTVTGALRSGATQPYKRVGRLQILLFTREMADLLDAGLPMDRAFSVLIAQTDSDAVRSLVTTMQADIRAGQPLSEALRKYPREFPDLYANMVRAGEVSGQLPAVMMRLADFMEKDQVRRSQIIAALTYPAVLVCVASIAVTFLLTYVIPKLASVFHDVGAALPLPTVILLTTSSGIARYWLEILIGLVGSILVFRAWARTASGRHAVDAFRLRVPLIGRVTQKVVSARLARTLGTLLSGGVPILDAMDICSTAVGNVVAADAILSARGEVRQGEPLHQAMMRTGAFLPVVEHMTAVGEETGRLPSMLLRTADTLDFEVDNALRRLTSLVEPAVVLLMGSFVGFVVLSILLPIFNATTLVK